jgi:DNA polymerase-1
MRAMVGRSEWEPSKLDDVRWALFGHLGAPRIHFTPTGQDATGQLILEGLSARDDTVGDFARALLRWRVCGKIRSTYIDGIRVNPETGRVHYNWKPFGTVSGRLSCRLQSAARYDPTDNASRVRELYIPREGNVFVYYDVSQAEMRLAAFLSADPVFMAACRGDVHANNAKVCFRTIAERGWLDGEAKKDPKRGKRFRDLVKNVGFAISYLAETDKVFATIKSKPEGRDVTYREVDNMLEALRRSYQVYFRWVEGNLADVRRRGWMRSPFLGRIRHLGHWPKITEVANYPIQSGLADVVNRRTIELDEPSRALGAEMVIQGHDACGYDCPAERADDLEGLITSVWAQPIPTLGGDLVLPIDLKRGERWSELG